MIRHTEEELAVAATAIKKYLMKHTIDKIIYKELDVNGTEIIGEEEFEDVDELQIEHVKEAPPRLQDDQHKVQDLLEKINLGTEKEPRITYVSSLLKEEVKKELVVLLKEFKDYFAWDYTEMPRLDREVVEHRLPIKPEFHPFQQPPRRMSKEVELKVKDEIEKLLKVGFIRPTRYAEWLSNIVL